MSEQKDLTSEVISTGITELDSILGGGLTAQRTI